MIVAKILREVDAELERLQTARAIIVALLKPTQTPPKALVRQEEAETPQAAVDLPAMQASLEPPAEQPAAAETHVMAPRRRGRPKGSMNRFPRAQRTYTKRIPEPTALTRVASTGPVFVSAAELDRQRRQPVVIAAAKAVEHTVSEGTLDALVREIAARRVDAAA